MTLSASHLIAQRLGLAAQGQVRSDFQQLLQELAHDDDPDRFIEQLRQQDDSSRAWQALIRALAIGETYFFRDRAHFDLLRERILPPLIQRRRDEGDLTLSLCSIGCATGEEAYSLAILLRECLPDLERWLIRLVGTDINRHALALAREGVYRPWSFRTNSDDLLRHFEPTQGGWRIRPYLRQMVSFREANLIRMTPVPQYDVIFCRNVLLYFTPERAATSEALLKDLLYPDGWLFLGQAEALRASREGWITHLYPGASAYQKHTHSDVASVREHRASPPAPVVPPPAANGSGSPSATSYEAATLALQQGNPDECARILHAILQADPNHARAYALLACLYADQRRTADAHAALDAALLREPLMADAYYLRGLLFMEASDTPQAQAALQRALYCQRNHPLASLMLGTILAQHGDFPKAVRLWHNALNAISALTPNSLISDLSDLTAERLTQLIRERIDGWR